MKTQIETYRAEEGGYHPFLIREGWQVAQLNYMSAQEVQNIDKLEAHHQTDEVFVLLTGNAVLITAGSTMDEPDFILQSMRSGVTYNIPKGTWHNIAMQPGSEVLIVEKSGTHLHDVEYAPLAEKKRAALISKVDEAFRG